MKKIMLALLVCVSLMLCGVTVLAAGEILCVLPEDFSDSLGTFTVVDEKAETGAFRNKVLFGRTDRQASNTIPAQLAIDIKAKGTYTVYAHTRDYDSSVGQRNFKLMVNKSSLDNKKLGAHKVNGWAWENAGKVELEKGTAILKVVDITAFYPRTDMIILSSDDSLVLPETHEKMQELAAKHRITKSDAELPTYLKPNQVFKKDKFYTAASSEIISNIGTWKVERNSWFSNDTPVKYTYLKGLAGTNPPEAKNATITFAVPKDGEYFLWVRTKDFVEDQGTRLFNCMIDGKMLEGDLGQHGIEGWAWERLLPGELKMGYHSLEFADTFKNYARFDMFLITDDGEFVPENKQSSAFKVLAKAKFEPEEVVPGIPCPVAAEPIGGNVKTYPMRPVSDGAVSVNGTYIECKSDFSEKNPLVSLKTAFAALNGSLSYETSEGICFSRNNKAYLFKEGDTFCYSGKKKIEMRSAACVKDGELMIPASFLAKLDNVKVKIEGKDIKITHRIWK